MVMGRSALQPSARQANTFQENLGCPTTFMSTYLTTWAQVSVENPGVFSGLHSATLENIQTSSND